MAAREQAPLSIEQSTRQWPWYSPDAVACCAELLAEGRSFDYYCGPEIEALESAFAARTGRRRALSFNSGTSALLAAYVALGIGPGDEVLVPSLTFLSTASPLFLLGAVPVLCDSGDEFGNVTVATLEPGLSARTRAIAVTHLWGQPCAMEEIMSFAADCGLPVLADCSHAHGSTYRRLDIGHFGDLAVFSIGSHKIVSGGLGGILLCDEDLHYDTGLLLGHFKQRRRSLTTPARAALADVGLGGNLRISPLAAVLAHSHLAELDEIMATKTLNVGAMSELLGALPGVERLPRAAGTTRDGWYECVLRVDPEGGHTRDSLLATLNQAGAPVGAPKTAPLHRASVFTGTRIADPPIARRAALPPAHTFRSGDLPRSEELYASWLGLPTSYMHGDIEPVLAATRRAIEEIVR
jgi:perosamine synthetase